ncbi:MAG: arylsulfatase [Planctomycetota bacterium]|nr:arylsulfatase [Planctomycetota bacterium]
MGLKSSGWLVFFAFAIFDYLGGFVWRASCIHAAQTPDEVVKPAIALPLQRPKFNGKIGNTYKESVPDWKPVQPIQPPENAPNIVLVVLDDVGFGHLSCYGGAIPTPNLDKLAKKGLRYNNFHTTALCSPSRACLLTGRNPHSIGMASLTEAATGFPAGYGQIPRGAGTIAQILKPQGYNTGAFGKWHLAPYTSYTAAGPFDHWPLGMGFERFYGFLGGETDQFAPLLVQDNSFIPIPGKEGYHLTEDLVDKTVSYIRDQQQANTGRPFFTYLALGACHAPFHAPREFLEKQRGKFDAGWDKERDATFARQKQLGIIPVDSILPPRNKEVQPWSELDETQRKVYCRLQEAFAAYLDHADHHLGRLFAALDQMEISDNTMIVVVSDNGASQEGLQHGATNTDRYRNFFPETPGEMLQHLDRIGSRQSDCHYPMGWAMVGNTPFKRWKQNTHRGGNSDPMIVSWPVKIKEAGAIRGQFHHIADIAPTLLEVIGTSAPDTIDGVRQMPMAGTSMAYSFSDGLAPTRKKVQYFEMMGSRALWADGWSAVSWHIKGTDWEKNAWELYHNEKDFTQSTDLAATHPEKLKEMQDLWWAEAKKYGVLPLDDRLYERASDPTRPVASISKPRYVYYPGTVIVHPLAAPQLMGHNHSITAEVDIPAKGAEGVLACAGGELGGWSFFIKDGKLHYVHNHLQLKEYGISSDKPVAPGKHKLGIAFRFTAESEIPTFYTGDVTILVDGKKVGEIKDVQTARAYSAMTGYGLQIGRNEGTPVSHEYLVPFRYTGPLDRVVIEVGKK